jgi:outer membrane lipoprotein-sorting protein
MTTRLWDRAALVPAQANQRVPAIVALPVGMPSLSDLFDFMRDAELRFETLRMRIEETTIATRGEQLVVMDVVVRHPGDARVTTTEPGRGTAGNFELWISDGATIQTYSGTHRLGTSRPVRNRPRGLDDQFPGSARVYEPVTPLPLETLAELFVHPAGYCQNVLATGRTWISGTDVVAGREAIVVECDHPRAIERVADRPDFHIQIAVDRAEGIITRLVETMGGAVTREAVVTSLEPDVSLPPSAFEFEFPDGTTMLF